MSESAIDHRSHICHLTFNEHITYVTAKVSKKLGILSRVRPLLTTESANRLYKSMILPLLEYCDVTWHGCSNENQKKIERMQNRAGRLVLKDSRELTSTSDAIIEKLGWKPLSVRRDEHTKELVKNCLNSFVPDLFKDYFNTRHCDIHSYNTRSRRNLYIDKINLEITKRGFFHKGAMMLIVIFSDLFLFSLHIFLVFLFSSSYN